MGDIVAESSFHLDPVSGPEFRQDPITGQWVILSPERAKRILPHEGKADVCPFCAGHESETPPELLAIRPADSQSNDPNWQVRVVPNRFPAVRNNDEPIPTSLGILQKQAGQGFHEVIAECPQHETRLSQLDPNHLQQLIEVWQQRTAAYRSHPDFLFVQIFKNHGLRAGASLEHCHSQLIALPFVPKQVQEEIDQCQRYWDQKQRCLFCDLIQREQDENVRIIDQSEHFLCVAAFAGRWPFETWIVPKRHTTHLDQINKQESMDLGRMLWKYLKRLDEKLLDPPFNLLIHQADFQSSRAHSYHWHIEILPRLAQPAGFEWATGCHINPVPPEQAAHFLRD